MTANPSLGTIPENVALRLGPGVLWLRAGDRTTGYYCNWSGPSPPMTFSPEETGALECLATGATRAEIRAHTNIGASQLECLLAKLHAWGSGALGWQHADEAQAVHDHNRTIELDRLRDIGLAMTAREDENARFHQFELVDPQLQFDQIETTISHAFRTPHPALDDRSYGEAFCDWLVESGRIQPGCRLIEIGCGLGYFANAILDRLAAGWPDIYDTLTYTLFDLSSELQSAQKSNCARHRDKVRFELGNIENHRFEDGRFDLVLSNEVIADLSVATVSIDNVENLTPKTEAERIAVEYQIECVPVALGGRSVAILNVGAIRMLRNIARCMAASGHAVITEYGTFGASPKAVQFSNHKEFTVHFGQLRHVARKLGFHPYLDTMGNAVGFGRGCETVRLEALRTLSECLLPDLGRDPLPMLAFWPDALEQALGGIYDDISNLRFLPLSHPESFSPFRFELMALSTQSPPAAADRCDVG